MAQEESVLAAHIHYLVSDLINRDIEELFPVIDEIYAGILDATDDENDFVEIFEWWTVSWEFAFVAQLMGEIVFETSYGFVWGRHTTGVSLSYDPVVISILEKIPQQ